MTRDREPAPNSPEDVGFVDQAKLAPPQVHECTTCHARIYWAKVVETGRAMPVDAQPDPVKGNVVLYRNRRTGRAIFARVLKAGEPPPPGTHLRTSHFATCPNAKRHRRNRR